MAYIVILAVSLISAYKTLGFYFWHDDFSVLYMARTGDCLITWLYQSYCSIFTLLDKFFNYNSYFYFFLGFLIFVLGGYSLYFFLGNFFNKKTSLLTTLVFSSIYLGAGVFLEAYDSITLFASLTFLFFALSFMAKTVKHKLSLSNLLIAIILFIFSVVILPARSTTYFVPVLCIIFLFSKNLNLNKKSFLGFVFLLAFFVFYWLIPLGLKSAGQSSGLLNYFINNLDVYQEFTQFVKTISSFLFLESLGVNDSSLRIITGVIILCLFIIGIFKARNNKIIFRYRFFSFVWLVFSYLPYALRSSWTFESTSRYLLPSLPGFLFFWATFGEKKIWKYITLGTIIFLIINSNIFFLKHSKISDKRRMFYHQLYSQLKELPKDTVLFVDFAKDIKSQADDYLRVGFTSSESAIAGYLGSNYKDFILVTEPLYLIELIGKDRLLSDNFISFYYGSDGRLVNTTDFSRKLLKNRGVVFSDSVNLNNNLSFIFDNNNGQWTSASGPLQIKFNERGFNPVLPFKLEIKARASMPKLPLPYTKDCHNDCFYDPDSYTLIADFLLLKKEIKEEMKVEASDFAEEAFGLYLTDDKRETYWIANRQKWFGGNHPVIKMVLTGHKLLDGLILYVKPGSRRPTSFEVTSKGQKVNYEFVDSGVGTDKIVFEKKISDLIEVRILSTNDGDSPMLYEIDPIPAGFSKINISEVGKVKNAPASIVKTEKDILLLSRMLSGGTKACVGWQSEGYGEGREDFELIVDGKEHIYQIEMPSMGLNTPDFTLDCINYPVDIYIKNANIIF